MVCAQARLAQTASCFLEASEARRSWSRAEEEASEASQGRQRGRPEPLTRRKFPRSAWGGRELQWQRTARARGQRTRHPPRGTSAKGTEPRTCQSPRIEQP